MKTRLVRLLALSVIFLGAFSVARATAASADYWGGWKWAGASNGDCLFAGTSIITGQNPDRHNVASANSCHTSNKVKVQEFEKNSGGSTIISCITLFDYNWRGCSIQNATGSGDYWEWNAFIIQNGITLSMGCANKGSSYSACYQSSD